MNELTLEEKIKLLSGKSGEEVAKKRNLRFPVMKDGPHGVSSHGICYPNMCLTACSWDKELLYFMGRSIGSDAIEEGVDVVLGPSVNLKRNPLCGRNFEYFSEDVCLSGELGAAYINGLQSTGTSACVKHFCCYNQETNRFSQSVFVEEDVMMDVYARIFKIINEKSAPDYLMTSYNRVNGEFTSESRHVLKDVLRDTLEYEGIVVSDWGGVDYRVRSLQAGVNINMPGDYDTTWVEVKNALNRGELSPYVLEEGIARVWKGVEKANKPKTPVPVAEEKMLQLTAESIVLLKNDGVLPLAKNSFAVVGALAKTPVFQGGGCAEIKGKNIPTPYEALCNRTDKTLAYADGYTFASARECDLAAMQKACEGEELVLFFVGALPWMDSEGYDRASVCLPQAQIDCLKALKEMGKKVISVVTGGSVLALGEVDACSDGVLECFYAGDWYSEALMQVLFGEVNPCGKLAESFPYAFEDYLPQENYVDERGCVRYREGKNVGYKYYLSKGVKTLYPFGYGLSYTKFAHSEIMVRKEGEGIVVESTVTNVGDLDGKTVVQVYLSYGEEARTLCAFEKVFVKAGESVCVKIPVDGEYFKTFAADKRGYVLRKGKYTVEICTDAQTPVLSQTVRKDEPFVCTRYTKLDELRQVGNGPALISKYFSEGIGRAVVGKEDYGARFVGRELDDTVFVRNVSYSMPLYLFTSLTFGLFSNAQLNEIIDKINRELVYDDE